MWTRHFRASLLALPLLAGTSAAVQAAPQILGIVASNGLPTPLHCADGYCSAYLASFCLQEGRYAPNKGSEYRLVPGGRLTIIASLGDGRSLRLPAEDLLTIRTRSGFTSLWLSLPEARLKALGATAAAVEVGPQTTVLPLAYAGDPHPQSADEVATAAGPLRQIAAQTFDRPGEGRRYGPADRAGDQPPARPQPALLGDDRGSLGRGGCQRPAKRHGRRQHRRRRQESSRNARARRAQALPGASAWRCARPS